MGTEKEEKEKPTPKKRKYVRKKEGIELVLASPLLAELEKLAIASDTTINQLIAEILKNHVERKESKTIQEAKWVCDYCDPPQEFSEYFTYSDHFFENHMNPELENLPKVNDV